jgi:hypothetical protein
MESRDIQGIGMAMLREFATGHIVHWAAGVGGSYLHFCQLGAEVRSNCWLDHSLHPSFDSWNHWAA